MHAIKRSVPAIKRSVPVPQIEIAIYRRSRREVFGYRAPLAARGQNIQEGVYNLAYVDRALVAPSLGWRDQRFNQSPFFVRQIARIAQHATIIMSAIFRRPHRRLSQIRPPPLNHK